MARVWERGANGASPTEPLELRITMGVAAMLAGACVGTLITAVLGAVPLILTMITGGSPADMLGIYGMAVIVSFVAWGVGILASLPLWVVMHLTGFTKPGHAIIAGAVAPGIIGLAAFQSIGFAVLGILGPFVALTIWRVYYGRAAA